MMFFIIVFDINGLVRPYGFRRSKSGVGISVANANDARVSIIRFTHNICTAWMQKRAFSKGEIVFSNVRITILIPNTNLFLENA